MKKSEKRKLFRKILDGAMSVGKGVVSIYNPVAGAAVGMAQGVVKGIAKEKEKNLSSPVGGVGNVDWYHIGGVVIIIGGGIAIVTGYMDLDTLKGLVKLFSQLF